MFSRYNSREYLDTAGFDHVIVRATQKVAASNFSDTQLTTISTVWQFIATQDDHPMTNTFQLPIILSIGRRQIIQ
jgi:hypothetical protein